MLRLLCFLLFLQLGAGEQNCAKSAKVDLQIIVDSSLSVQKENFHTMMKKISSSIVNEFEIGADKTRVALFKYSKRRVMRNEFNLNSFSTKSDIRKKIEDTKYEGGNTMTAMAMKLALNSFKQQQRKNKDTARICLVFTDGEASDKENVPSAAQAWAEDGVTVFAIGIGSNVKHDGLKAIAGADERAFEVATFDAIADIASGLLKHICEKAGKPTIAPPKPGYAYSLVRHRFKVHPEKKTWKDAAKTCHSEGGTLIKVDDPSVNDWLAKQDPKLGVLWIGASDEAHEGKYTWSDGSPTSLSYWWPNEPNNCCGGQNCAVVNFKKPGKWDDQGCNVKNAFVCQIISPRQFKVHSEKQSWKDAANTCQSEGGELVQVDHPSVNTWLARQDPKLGSIWIGATDEGHEGKFAWSDGSSATSPYWWPGEPNNCCGGQNCAVVNFRKPGKWDDQACHVKHPFVCQTIVKRGFKVHRDKKTWKDAAKTCQSEGGELVKVDHPTVNAWLAKQDPKLGVLWIGASDEGHEGKYTWSDGSPTSAAYWWPKEPNNCCGGQNCAVVNFKKPGKWDDQGCHVKNAFVCQFIF